LRRCNGLAATLAAVCIGSAPIAWSESRESFDMTVPAPPSPITIDGQDWLIYELHLTNFSREPLRILKVDVLDERDTAWSFEGRDLAPRLGLAGVSRAEIQALRPGERAIVYLEVRAHDRRAARALRHRVRHETAHQEVAEVVGGEVAVRDETGAALGPPLRGGPWAAVYAWEWPRGHRRVYYTLEGRARLPGRFAIDWVRKDSEGHSARGDADVVKNSLGYGADVLAVADARVAAVREGLAEAERVSANPKHALDQAAGNYVALDLGDGRFAIYEHLAPGSIRVKRGDRVRRGQVLAALGFTGDSTEPHLHFHVADSPSPLAGEGLPFELARFRVTESGAAQIRQRERPAPNALVIFD
jgi:murein DD-endopeptidase MepM/ murein hydrolase activator NlpD